MEFDRLLPLKTEVLISLELPDSSIESGELASLRRRPKIKNGQVKSVFL